MSDTLLTISGDQLVQIGSGDNILLIAGEAGLFIFVEDSMGTVFNGAKSSLSGAVTVSATTFPITDIGGFLSVGGSGDWFYAQLTDGYGAYEVVKVDVGNSSVNGLSVTRGQGGAAKAWPAGTQIWQCLDINTLNVFPQQGVARSVAFNPNSALTPNYKGEKVYQSDDVLWWQSIDAITQEWRLIAGVVYVADVTFDPAAGTYANGQTLTMSCVTPGVTIRYTTDGSTPDENSTAYSAPITIPEDATTTYKARAFGANRWESPSQNVTTGAYTLQSGFTGDTLILAAANLIPRKPVVFNDGGGDKLYVVGAGSPSKLYSWDFSGGSWTLVDGSWPTNSDSSSAKNPLVLGSDLYVIGSVGILLKLVAGNLTAITNLVSGVQYIGWVQNSKIHMGIDEGVNENIKRYDSGVNWTQILDAGTNPRMGVMLNNNFYWLNSSNFRLYEFNGVTNTEVAPPGSTNSSWEGIEVYNGVIYASGKAPKNTARDGISYWNGVDDWVTLFYVEEPPHNMDGNIGPFQYVASEDAWYFYSGTNLRELYKWTSGGGFEHLATTASTLPIEIMFTYNDRVFALSDDMQLVELTIS
jgi:hypothetical protein